MLYVKLLKMPVTTRSQLKNISASTLAFAKPVEKPITKVRPDTQEAILPWFVATIKEGLADVEKYNLEKYKARLYQENDKIRMYYYDTIRRVTEMMYIISHYFPTVISMSLNMSKFGQVVYAKVQELYKRIRAEKIYKPETQEEKEIVAAFIYTLQDVEKMIIQYLPVEQPIKRVRKLVDYTGMDTIEPESEYDGITDIWYDESVWYDSDYVPDEDEEDEDDDLDKYVVYENEEDYDYGEEPDEDEHDYSEDEDYVPEDEEVYEDDEVFEITVNPKQGKHTRFTYDDEC